jgi:hypothetical protein
MWRRVDLMYTVASEEQIASIFIVEKCASKELACVGGSRSTRRYIPEDGIHHSHRCENLKLYIFWSCYYFLLFKMYVILPPGDDTICRNLQWILNKILGLTNSRADAHKTTKYNSRAA